MATAIYVRKSTESEDRQVQSLEDQVKVLRELADREGIRIAEEITESKSAKEPGTRPEFERLIAKVRKGELSGILVWHVNRLSRNMVDGGVVSHLLMTGALRFIQTPERTYRPEDSALLLAIENGMSTSFVQDLSRNVKRGLDGKASRGWLPGRAPFGYLNDRNKEIVPDPFRFELLRQGWEMIASGGFTIAQVRRHLTERGLQGPDGQAVTSSLFYAMFKKEFYSGRFYYQGQWRTGKHTAMVTESQFHAVQVALGRAPKVKEHRAKHPFAGVFRCPVCGCQITAETKVKRYKKSATSRSYTYYRCTGFKGCSKASVEASVLDSVVAKVVELLKIQPAYAEWAKGQAAEHHGADIEAMQTGEQALERKIRQLESRLLRLRDMRLDDEIGADDYSIEKSRLSSELRVASDRLDDHRRLSKGLHEQTEKAIQNLEDLNGFDELSSEYRRGLLRSLTQKCFLTLEKAEFYVDELIFKIATFEPGEMSFQSGKSSDFGLVFSSWQGDSEDIRTLGKETMFGASGSSVCISVTIPTFDVTVSSDTATFASSDNRLGSPIEKQAVTQK